MGLIEKSIRNRSNQKLAAEVFTTTALTYDEVVAAVRAHCDAQNAEMSRGIAQTQANAKTRFGKWVTSLNDPAKSHYYISPRPESRQILIGFGQRPEPILAGRGNTHDGVWAARLSYPAGGNVVGMTLLKWVIGGNDGVLRNRSFYESLLDSVPRLIGGPPAAAAPSTPAGSAAPDGLTGAVDGFTGAGDAVVSSVPPADVAAQAATVTADPASLPAEQLAEARQATIGDWAADLEASFPFLERVDLAALAGLRAMLAVHTGYFSSTYPSESRPGPGQLSDASTHSLLRGRWIMPSGTAYLDCGAPKPDLSFATDWQLRYGIGEGGAVTIEVPYHRKAGAGVRSAELLVATRDALADVLAAGIHLRLDDGPPVTDGLIASMPSAVPGYPDNDNSPFAQDFLGGTTASYGVPVALPVSARSAVLAAMHGARWRQSQPTGDALCVISLAGGRPFDAGSVTLRRGAEHDLLVIDLPASLEPIERERSYRAATRFLVTLFRALEQSEPAVSEAVSAYLRSFTADTQRAWAAAVSARKKDHPPGLWVSKWDRATAAPMVPVAAGRWYPIGVRVTASSPVDCLSLAMSAADWVTSYKRKRPILRPDGRPSGRTGFTSRRCGLLYNDADKLTPCLRFASAEEVWDQLMPKVRLAQAWFWEVTARSGAAGDGGPSGDGPAGSATLLVTGWSHADGVLGYGEDLLSMLRAFADLAAAADDQARIQTLYLAT